MGIHNCYKCNCDPGPFFIWSSSRNFNKEKFLEILGKNDRLTKSELKKGVEVCYECYNELKKSYGK